MKKIILAASIILGGSAAAVVAPDVASAAVTTCHTQQLSSRSVRTTCKGTGLFALLAECTSMSGARYWPQDWATAPYGTAFIQCRSGYRLTWIEVER